MDYGNVVSSSFEYTKDALVGKWMQWVILAVLSLVQMLTFSVVPLLSGYIVRVLSGTTPAPEIEDWGRLFIDGWKLNIIALVYMIPAILVFLVLGGLSIIAGMGAGDAGGVAAVLGAAAGAFVALIVAVILSFIALFGIMRFAHTDSVGEAFNFGAIFEHIGKLGWGTWIIAVVILLVIAAIYGFVVGLLNVIPLLGFIIGIFLNVAFALFYGRDFALVYEDVPAPA